MADHRRRITQRRPHIILAEIGKIRDDLVNASPTGQHLQYIAHPHPRPDHDRPPTANGGINGDTGKACERHGRNLADDRIDCYPPTMTKLTPIESEFATTEEAEAYDAWFRAEVEASLADPRPRIPHDPVMAQMQAIIDRRKNA